MPRKQFTPEQKREYFAGLRNQWQAAKALAAADDSIGAMYTQLCTMGVGDISMYNVSLILMQARQLNLDGLPYVDFKTYEMWRKAGFQVRKGETSPVFSLTWIGTKSDDETEATDRPKYPKLTHLFHSSQVEAITV